MRGIIINPYAKVVSVVYDDFQLIEILHYHLQALTRSVVPLEGKNHLILDMDGPFKLKQKWWGFKGFPNMVCAGKGLIIGVVDSSDGLVIVPPDADRQKMVDLVEWVTEEEAHRRLSDKVDPELLGSMRRIHVDRSGNAGTLQ